MQAGIHSMERLERLVRRVMSADTATQAEGMHGLASVGMSVGDRQELLERLEAKFGAVQSTDRQ